MSRFNRVLCVVVAAAVLCTGISTVLAQAQPKASIVSIYRIAPGKHLAFLKWMAGLDLIPTIKDIRYSIERLRDAELGRHRGWLAGLDVSERELNRD